MEWVGFGSKRKEVRKLLDRIQQRIKASKSLTGGGGKVEGECFIQRKEPGKEGKITG